MGETYWYARADDSATPSGPFHADREAVDVGANERLRPIDGSVVDGYREEGSTYSEPGESICSCDAGDACDACGGDCPVVKSDGEVCGRDRPCSYHDDE